MSVYGFKRIDNLPEYMNFSYSFNVLTVFAVVTATYSLFSFGVNLKMILFYAKNRHSDAMKNSLRPDVLRLFLLMQLWNAFHVLLDFMVVRIPLTSAFTSFCAWSKPDLFLSILSLLFTGCVYTCHLLTLLFCILRVALLYAVEYQKETVSKIFNVLVPLLILLGHSLGVPQFLIADSSCFQMADPFPFGAVVITSVSGQSGMVSQTSGSSRDIILKSTYAIVYVICTQTTVILLVISTILMFAKLQEKRKSSSELHRKYSSKAEKTLTATMILMVLPVVMPEVLSLVDIFDYTYYSYLFLLRVVCLDARRNLPQQRLAGPAEN
ncbi:unnamed protein product [Caenorhabditis sp. 36 PRJEB53466]|nr:unnamed protein product [Caenorhabditis sp. 36 PRJEB53466]